MGSRLPVAEPAVPANRSRTGEAVPGTPAIAVSPAYRTTPPGVANVALTGFEYLDVGPTTDRSVNGRPTVDGKVDIEDLLDVLPDVQRVEHLHVGEAVEEDDALDELVGMLHFLDRFLAPLLGEILVAPVIQQPVMQPVLTNGG